MTEWRYEKRDGKPASFIVLNPDGAIAAQTWCEEYAEQIVAALSADTQETGGD